jgi:histidinol-phosphate aminotransferase
MQIKDQLTNLKPYQPGKPIEEVKKEYNLTHIVKLASNENPYGSSERAKKAIQDELNQLALYPDGYSAQLRESLARFLKVEENEIIFGNGSDEIVQIICRAFLKKGTNTVMATPLINGYHDLDSMLAAIDEQTKVIWLCSPNNPTGTYINEKSLHTFMNKVPGHVLVILDEAYYEYVTASDFPVTLPLIKEYKNVMILRTFSKAYGLAALRVGYGIANKELIKSIEPAREPFNTNRLGQTAALHALSDQEFIKQCSEKNKQGLEQFYQFSKEHGLSYYPSEGNFILIDFNRDADEVFQALLEKGYIVRSGKALGFPTSIRITIGTKEQNEEILQILTELIS